MNQLSLRFSPVLIGLLSACGSGGADTGTAAGGATSTAVVASGWNALDACATLGKANAAAAAGTPVTSAELTTRVEAIPGSAAFSMCTFTLANGAKLLVLTRQAPGPDASPEAIEKARTADGSLPPAVDVPGLGKAAMWSDALKGLQVFVDDTRYFTINFAGLPAGEDPKAKSIAVARKLL